MTYAGDGDKLKVSLEEDGVVVKCAIRTMIPEVVWCRIFCL